jgi:ribose/xylose/arabinose/galactoside ABC-type transport system permease subunit
MALASCLALGAVNAFGMTRIGIPSFIMTLAMLQIAAGIAPCWSEGRSLTLFHPLSPHWARARWAPCRGSSSLPRCSCSLATLC